MDHQGSHIGNSEQAACGANNVNNQLIYNGSNGTLNNNNRINSNQVRVVLDLYHQEDCPSGMSPADWFGYYRTARKHKKNKPSHIKFSLNLFSNLENIMNSVADMEYIPGRSTVFAVLLPRPREIIAAAFGDRIVQTYLVQRILPYLEEYLNPDSYSCRVGKGALRAAQHLCEVIHDATGGYVMDAWIYKIDFKGFFMSVDTELWVKRLCAWMDENVKTQDVEWLKYVARVIYQSLPQMNCDVSGDPMLMRQVPAHKRQYGKASFIGIPIGNVSSQTLILFATTPFLSFIGHFVCGYSHYTDDNSGVVTDKDQFLSYRKTIEDFASTDSHFIIHPDKFYFQHYSKGVEFLGYRIRYGRLLPSKRLMHNFSWKINKAVRKASESREWMLGAKEHTMSVVNSCCGLLKHTSSYNYRKRQLTTLKNSAWGEVFDFDEDGWLKVTVKDKYKKNNYHKYIAKKYKQKLFKQ